jgi:hypothetical protein
MRSTKALKGVFKMKKLILILVGVVLTVGVLGAAGYVYAQVEEPSETSEAGEAPEFPFGRGGMPRGRSRMPGGFGMDKLGPGNFFGMGAAPDDPLHEYLFPAMAEAFGLTEAQIEAFQVARETVQGIKDDLSAEEIHETMQQALTNAIDAALEEGAITQEEADQMIERMEQMGERGFPGGFPLDTERSELLHEYMDPALADALGISIEELQAMKEDGLNLKDYADEQGWSNEDLKDFMTGVYTEAINAALEDGAITQDQADRLLERLENYDGRLPFGMPRSPRGWWNTGE